MDAITITLSIFMFVAVLLMAAGALAALRLVPPASRDQPGNRPPRRHAALGLHPEFLAGGFSGLAACAVLVGVFLVGAAVGQARAEELALNDDSRAVPPAGDLGDGQGRQDERRPAERSAAVQGHEGRSPGEQSPHELSVDPGADARRSLFPPHRPGWVNDNLWTRDSLWARDELGRAGLPKQLAVTSGPQLTVYECERSLNDELKRATDEYVNRYLGSSKAALLLNYDLDAIQQRLVSHDPQYTYSGPIHSPTVGEMREEVRLLVFDERFQHELGERWNQVMATSRLASTGLIAGGVLGLLGLIFAFLKVDTATRGFYTGRLQLLTLAGILGMIAAGVMIARWIPWM